MLKKLSTIGSSKGLILDKTLLGLLGIENANQVSIAVEGRRLIIAPPYHEPVEELRARLHNAQDGGATDAEVNRATRRTRGETVRKLKANRGGRHG
jgi:antitoxin component of MazEF toxin-antitoxin module